MIKLIALDVDGTLTDGKLYIGNSGECLKGFNVKDGLAIVGAIQNGIEVAIITGKESEIVALRCEELGIKEVHQKIGNKIEKLKELSEKYNLEPNEIAYMGDDLNDYSAIRFAGHTGMPADGAHELSEMVDFISTKKGGEGAVREFIEAIMRKQDLWFNIVKKYAEMN
ncbi:MAG: KdsC family phosphatase [Fusobacteriaceae bacterium]